MLREWAIAIKRWLIFPPHLTNISALRGETWNPKIANFHLNTVTNDDNNYDNDAVDELTERRGKKDDRGDGVSETQRNEDHW